MSNNKNQVPLNDKKQTRVVEVVERVPAAPGFCPESLQQQGREGC